MFYSLTNCRNWWSCYSQLKDQKVSWERRKFIPWASSVLWQHPPRRRRRDQFGRRRPSDVGQTVQESDPPARDRGTRWGELSGRCTPLRSLWQHYHPSYCHLISLIKYNELTDRNVSVTSLETCFMLIGPSGMTDYCSYSPGIGKIYCNLNSWSSAVLIFPISVNWLVNCDHKQCTWVYSSLIWLWASWH